MPEYFWVLLPLGGLAVLLAVPVVRTSLGSKSILSIMLQALQRWRAERIHRNGVRKRVVDAVTTSFSESETPDQLSKRLAALNEPRQYLAQFGPAAFASAMEVVRGAGRLSPARKTLLAGIMGDLDVPPEVVEPARKALSRYEVLDGLDRGVLPQTEDPGLVLLEGETQYWSAPGAILEERILRREYVGGSAGVSFRVAKGVYVRTGGFKGHIESQKGIVPVSNGALVVTNHRIIFHGDNKSADVRWNRVLDFEFFADGVRFSVSNRSKPTLIRFNDHNDAEIVHGIIEQVLKRLHNPP